MEKIILNKSNGDVFFEAEREKNNAFIHINWVGIQTIESIMLGSNQLIQLLHKKRCSKILNSNIELIGPWDDGAIFLGNRWAFKAKMAGVIYYAHVLAPGIYGKNSFKHFQDAGSKFLNINVFHKDEEAEQWLLSL